MNADEQLLADEKKFAKEFKKMRADDALRERLLIATLACVAERGFAATSTDEIVRRANLSAGTLFRLYPTKLVLLRAAYAHACKALQGGGDIELEGELLREQLWDLWHRAWQNALAYPAAFHYWRLYRATPLDTEWGFPDDMRLGPFKGVSFMMHLACRPAHYTEWDGWLAAAQWSAAVQFVLAPARPHKYHSPIPIVAPTPTQVLGQAFRAYWAGLGLNDNRPGVQHAYIHS